jgi:ornithine cyclodeaminase
MKYFDKVRHLDSINLGIIGFGPIGRYHLKVASELFKDRIKKVCIYDIRPTSESVEYGEGNTAIIVKGWEEAYDQADILITATVSKAQYIDKKPKQGSLLLNVSLRDFKTSIFEHVKETIIVDDWEEVCREKTDIEMMHKEKGLKKEDTKSIVDVVCNHCLNELDDITPIMFNPMGMAVFDITTGVHYLNKAAEMGIGLELK